MLRVLLFCMIIVPNIVIADKSPRAIARDYQTTQTVTFVPIMVSDITIIVPTGSGLPPDPGKRGRETIAGIDSDGDGIRDDVERKVSLMFPSNPTARAYGYVMAQKYQTLIENPYMSKEKTKQVISDIFQTTDCIDKAVNYNSREKIMPYVLNTKKRSLEYVKLLENINGMVLPDSKSCNQ